jgi:hypothetical protein
MESDSITDRNRPYHNAKIDGEARKIDPPVNAIRSAPILDPFCTYESGTTCTQMILQNVDWGESLSGRCDRRRSATP